MLTNSTSKMSLLITSSAMLIAANTACFAGTTTGAVKAYQADSYEPGRGACVKMNPDFPGTGWSCVYDNGHLYKELGDLLLSAYLYKLTCTVWSDTTAYDGHNVITAVECDPLPPLIQNSSSHR